MKENMIEPRFDLQDQLCFAKKNPLCVYTFLPAAKLLV